MNDDQDFVRTLLADPSNDTLRLAYADWLEERGDARAEYLRLEAELANPELRDQHRARLEGRRLEIHVAVDPRRYLEWLEEPGGTRAECEAVEDALLDMERADLQRHSMRLRLHELRKQLDPGWQALLDRPPVENCDLRFKFRCPKQWQSLQLTGDGRIRFCAACRKNVYYCGTVGEARDHARQGHCVAVNSHQKRTPDDLVENDIFDSDFNLPALVPTGSQAVDVPEEGCVLGMMDSGMADVDWEEAPRRPWWKFW